jgi:lysophospholipase L1-like esterase
MTITTSRPLHVTVTTDPTHGQDVPVTGGPAGPDRWAGSLRIGLRVGVCLGAYLAACVAFGAVRGTSVFLSVLAIFALGLILIQTHRSVRDTDAAKRPRWLCVGAVAGLGAGLLIVGWLGAWDGASLYGGALVYVSVGLAIGIWRRSTKGPHRGVALGAVGGSAVLALAGLAVAALGVRWTWWVALLGVLTAPIGVALGSEIALRRGGWGVKQSLGSTAGGLVLLVIGLVLLHGVGVNGAYLTAATALIVGLMLAVAARSNIDIVVLITVAAVVWTFGQQSVPMPEALRPSDGEPFFVALGDSYMSGEGADVYYEGTNTPGQSTCRRAPSAYAPQLTLERSVRVPRQLAFVACSGADIEDVVAPDASAETQVARLRAELEALELSDENLAFVLVSMGGNDALFGTVGRTCLLPIECTDLAPAFLDNLADVEEELAGAYADLRAQLPGRDVVVVPYPVPIHPERCSESVFSAREQAFLHDFTEHLNQAVMAAARRAGLPVVTTMPGALAGMRFCDPEAEDVGVNFLAGNSVMGTFEQSVNPTNWLHNSLHPNARGHEAMRSALVAWLRQHPELHPLPEQPVAGPTTSPATDDGGSATDSPCLGARGKALEGCARNWAAQQTARVVLHSGWRLLPALLGAWLLALPLVRLWSRIFDDHPPQHAEEQS